MQAPVSQAICMQRLLVWLPFPAATLVKDVDWLAYSLRSSACALSHTGHETHASMLRQNRPIHSFRQSLAAEGRLHAENLTR